MASSLRKEWFKNGYRYVYKEHHRDVIEENWSPEKARFVNMESFIDVYKDDEFVGEMNLATRRMPDQPLETTVTTVSVKKDHRRQGIATEMYKIAEQMLGHKITKSHYTTDLGEKLWNNPKRPFGQVQAMGSFLESVEKKYWVEADIIRKKSLRSKTRETVKPAPLENARPSSKFTALEKQLSGKLAADVLKKIKSKTSLNASDLEALVRMTPRLIGAILSDLKVVNKAKNDALTRRLADRLRSK